MFYIYAIRPLDKSQKVIYIGATKDVEARWYGHCKAASNHNSYVYQEIRNMGGISQFEIMILSEHDDVGETAEKELALMDHFRSIGYHVLNSGKVKYTGGVAASVAPIALPKKIKTWQAEARKREARKREARKEEIENAKRLAQELLQKEREARNEKELLENPSIYEEKAGYKIPEKMIENYSVVLSYK